MTGTYTLKSIYADGEDFTKSGRRKAPRGNLMRWVVLMLVGLSACFGGEEPEPAMIPADAGQAPSICMAWYHECNCSYVCTDETAYNARLENGEGNCDVQCEDASEENVPTDPCEEVDGICQWVMD